MSRPDWDAMKLARDGHLEPTKVRSSRHAWVRPIWVREYVSERGTIIRELDDGSAFEYAAVPGSPAPEEK